MSRDEMSRFEGAMATVATDIQALEARHVLQTYRRTPVTFVRGQGVRLYDSDGREYVDLLSGIGVAALGHAHPGLARAIADQAQTLLHTSNLFFHPLQGRLAERLADLSGLRRAFFCNSGAEAVEACLKFARRYWHTRGTPRAEIVALEESFHGRTFGALSVTSDEHYRAPFEPLVPGVRFVPADDPDALLGAVSDRTAAIIAEPIQGEGGVRPLTSSFARRSWKRPDARGPWSSQTKCRAVSAVPGDLSTPARSVSRRISSRLARRSAEGCRSARRS